MRYLKYSFLILFSFILTACHKPPANEHQGYVEARLTYLSSPYSGQLMKLPVVRGESVKKGSLLFALNQAPEMYDFKEALDNTKAAAANLEDLKLGERPSELASIHAQIKKAKADLAYSEKTLVRYQHLSKHQYVSKEDLDAYTNEAKAARADLQQLTADLMTAKLPSRAYRVKEADAKLGAAVESFQKAHWVMDQKTVASPQVATVYDTYYRLGEQVPADHPVLSLLTKDQFKIVFYVPESELSSIHLGQQVTLSTDYSKETAKAKITFINDMAEYTPPVVYSRYAQTTLVYRVEVAPIEPAQLNLHPGQPVLVTT